MRRLIVQVIAAINAAYLTCLIKEHKLKIYKHVNALLLQLRLFYKLILSSSISLKMQGNAYWEFL